MTKQCRTCGEIKSTNEFHKALSNKGGLHHDCKDCRKTIEKNRYEQNREFRIGQSLGYVKSNPGRARNVRHGLEPGTIENMIEVQEFKCANPACDNPIVGYPGKVDHDHNCCPGDYSCGKCVRGILCQSCNFALGHVKDDIDKLMGLINYLELSRFMELQEV